MILRRSSRTDPRLVLGSALAFALPFSAELGANCGPVAVVETNDVSALLVYHERTRVGKVLIETIAKAGVPRWLKQAEQA